jgi:hypothetical protein
MRTRTSAPIILAVLAAATGTAGTATRAAGDCLAAPNAMSPPSSHWYYRLDRATHRKCWYLGPQAQGVKHRRAVAATAAASAQAVAPAAPVSDAPAAALPAPSPPIGGETVADAAFTLRWPKAAEAGAIAGAPRPDDGRVAGVASRGAAAAPPATSGPDRIAARSVPTTAERAPAEPARAERAQPVPVSKPPAAGLADQPSGLPAALAGVAVVLALVGAMLVRAGRRTIIRLDPDEAHSPDERMGQFFANIRRGLGEFPANAETDENTSMRIRRGLREVPAQAGTDADDAPLMPAAGDIADATLQPDIAPLAPAEIDAAPDVERSLRQLLQAWERRAA